MQILRDGHRRRWEKAQKALTKGIPCRQHRHSSAHLRVQSPSRLSCGFAICTGERDFQRGLFLKDPSSSSKPLLILRSSLVSRTSPTIHRRPPTAFALCWLMWTRPYLSTCTGEERMTIYKNTTEHLVIRR